MNIVGLDGKLQKINLAKYLNPNNSKSQYHLNTRNLLKRLFPCDTVIEELCITGTQRLYFDFFVPLRKLIIEVQDRQHKEFVPHFHENPLNFLKGKSRDNKKIKVCELNNWTLITLWYDEDESTWTQKILQAK